MTSFETRQRDARQFRSGILYLEQNQNAPLHDVINVLVRKCPDLGFEYLSILLADWAQQFRLENQAEIDSTLLKALELRAG